MKKILISVILIFALLLTFVSCAKDNEKDSTDSSSSVNSSQSSKKSSSTKTEDIDPDPDPNREIIDRTDEGELL